MISYSARKMPNQADKPVAQGVSLSASVIHGAHHHRYL